MDKDTKDFILGVGSIFLIGWILKQLLTKKEYYKCPRCNYPVDNSMCQCPNCGQPLKW